MEEKIYKIMRGAGALNIVLGVISLVVGIAAGVLLIIRQVNRSAVEVFHACFGRTLIEVGFDLALQVGNKARIALACHDSKRVHALYELLTANLNILPFAVLVDAQAQTTTDLLTLCRGVVGMLQGAYLEHVRVVPALTQSGV